MVKLIKFLFRYSPMLIFMAIVANVLTGLINIYLLALINEGITNIGGLSVFKIWLFVAACLLLPALRILGQYLTVSLSQKAVYQLRLQLCRHILRAPLRRTEEIGPSRMLAALTNDVTTVSAALTLLPLGFMHISVLLAGFGYLFWLNLAAGSGLLLVTIVASLVFVMVTTKAQTFFQRARNDQDDMYRHFDAVTRGTKELKLHSRRKQFFMDDEVETTAASYRTNNITAVILFFGAASVGHMLFFAAIGVCVFWLPHLQVGIDTKVLVGYSLVLLYMILPLDALTGLVAPFGNAVISLNRLDGLGLLLDDMNKEIEILDPPEPEWKKLEYAGMVHTYHREKENQTFKMGPIDLEIQPGELVFIVGGNGSGKTTLAKMMTGLYVPERGEIRKDGERITDENRDAFRQFFSVVFSDFYLFEKLLGLERHELDKASKEFLTKLHLNHKVKVKDGTLSTLDLSQGQRKRLALLTAFLEDRPIYLFDEWAADQDPYFKDIFYNQLLPELKARNKTVIVISHDDHYYHVADRLIKLDYGQVDFDLPREKWEALSPVATPKSG